MLCQEKCEVPSGGNFRKPGCTVLSDIFVNVENTDVFPGPFQYYYKGNRCRHLSKTQKTEIFGGMVGGSGGIEMGRLTLALGESKYQLSRMSLPAIPIAADGRSVDACVDNGSPFLTETISTRAGLLRKGTTEYRRHPVRILLHYSILHRVYCTLVFFTSKGFGRGVELLE